MMMGRVLLSFLGRPTLCTVPTMNPSLLFSSGMISAIISSTSFLTSLVAYCIVKCHDLLLLLQVLFLEFLVAMGAAILTIVAMPHLDIVTNVTILNGVVVLSALLQVITQCFAKERNRFLLPSIFAFISFCWVRPVLYLYITKHPTDIKMIIWVGLAVGASFLVSFNWWENYLRLISKNSSSVFLKNLCKDLTKCQNMLNILTSLLRIVVTVCVIGAFVPLDKMDWNIVTSIPSRETKIIAIIIGVQLISSALCHWFSLVACKMHALRRCFILPLYLASLAVMVLFIVPVIVYYQDYRTSLNGTAINFTADIGSLTVSWWLGLLLATLHLWYLNVDRIQRTQDLFIRRLYEGAFIEQSLLLNTRFDIMVADTLMVYLCATMWHETYDEMMNIIISIFRLDKYRPKTDQKYTDFTFETHIYFDDAFKDVKGSRGRHLNIYAQHLVEILTEVYTKKQQIPDQKIIRTPYGGRLVVTMPHGNIIWVHFKDKELIRHKKRWSQVMYLYYLLGWKLMNKLYTRWQKGEDKAELRAEIEQNKLCMFLQKEKHNTYILALDGDTDFQPAAVMLLIDRLKMYPSVGAACGRIHPTGSGPAVWFQKFEYAVSHWLQKTAEHVIGCVLCSPGCFSLFRAAALMDDNVMKKYSTKSTEASQYIQYDQGEDRWLCTLLLKQGWRVEYNAAADAYTNAPENFGELYNQRRRWGPSTMANVVDLLGSTSTISNRNRSMSKPFMFYQLFAIASSILAPATICLMIAGWCLVIALVLAVIPPIIYLVLCFKLKSETQIKIAGLLSIMYAFLMLVVTLSIIGSMVKENTILTPSSIFVIAISSIYIITAIMHPQEIQLIFHGLIYILAIPSAYLLLSIYSMVNMNNVSWGTRETKPAAGAVTPEPSTPQTITQKGRYQVDTKKSLLQQKIGNDLRELRNKVNFAYFMLNALWLVATFTLQLSAAVSITIPILDFNLKPTGKNIQIDPIGFMFILGFATMVGIQFLTMFYHRIYTLIHYVAFLDTEPKVEKNEPKEAYLSGKRVSKTCCC
uniref:chitin synthase n=1 Tax=Sander lucioperca TaxID=283035 RepID=A0A8C9XJS5_SANLU